LKPEGAKVLLGEHTMSRALLLADIQAAKEAISVAENELQAVVGDDAPAPRAEMAEADEVVRAASLKLRAADAKLVELKAKLVELNESMALAKLEAARTAVDEAEKHLDGVLREIAVVPGAETTWWSKVVRDAFAKLKTAQTTLDDLESIATD
jgi:hypothetical protein